MMLTVISSLLTMVCSVAALTWKRDPARSFCLISEHCPNLYFCSKHECKLPKSLAEFRTVTRIFRSRQRQSSSEDEKCQTHSDCTAVGYLCDMQDGKCRKLSKVFQKIGNKCKDLKKSCYVDSDCSCSGHQMKCEAEPDEKEKECVFVNKVSSSSSTSSTSSLSMIETKRRIPKNHDVAINEIEQE